MAALNRGKYVVEHMQQTPSVADGLAIMAQAYCFWISMTSPRTQSACCVRIFLIIPISNRDAS